MPWRTIHVHCPVVKCYVRMRCASGSQLWCLGDEYQPPLRSRNHHFQCRKICSPWKRVCRRDDEDVVWVLSPGNKMAETIDSEVSCSHFCVASCWITSGIDSSLRWLQTAATCCTLNIFRINSSPTLKHLTCSSFNMKAADIFLEIAEGSYGRMETPKTCQKWF